MIQHDRKGGYRLSLVFYLIMELQAIRYHLPNYCKPHSVSRWNLPSILFSPEPKPTAECLCLRPARRSARCRARAGRFCSVQGSSVGWGSDVTSPQMILGFAWPPPLFAATISSFNSFFREGPFHSFFTPSANGINSSSLKTTEPCKLLLALAKTAH